MDEKRMQAYVRLIIQLLDCGQGEEGTVLQAHAELVDIDLMVVMGQYADWLDSQGNSNARWLRQFAAYEVTLAVGLGEARTGSGDAADFALEILRLIVQTQCDHAQVYGFLRANHVKQLDEKLLFALPEVFTNLAQKNNPAMIADVFVDFGNLINQFPLGSRMLNLELGIAAYEQALTVRTIAVMPVEWAQTTMNLATAYKNRIKGDRAENIEQAINAYEQALNVMPKAVMPIEWATANNNLANAYNSRVKGDRAENIEQAIKAYEQALTVRTKAAMPIQWATTTNNLAFAYNKRIKGDRAENIEQAINAYSQALTVRTKAAMPIEWAQTHHNLALAYMNRIKGDRAENIEQALVAYEQALSVMTKAAMPIEWAQTTNNLASLYDKRIKGDRAENIEQAIVAYKSSLEIFTPTTLPDDCRRTSGLLANLYSDQTHWTEAASTYDIALQAAEICYQRSDFLDSKSSELSTTAELPRRAAYAYAKAGDLPKVIETLEQGRARGLSESLSRDRANLTQLEQTDLDLYSEYKNLTTQQRNLEIQQRNLEITLSRQEIQTSSQILRQQLQDTICQIRQIPSHADFLQEPTFVDIQQVIISDCPLVHVVITPNGGMALITTVNSIEVLWLDDLTDKFLQKLLVGSGNIEDLDSAGWFSGYDQASINRETWYEAIDTTTRQLWDNLMGPIVQHLKTLGYDRATLIPTGYLSLLPLHAAWTEDTTRPTGRRYALDDIHFTYTPNTRSLTAAREIANRPFTDSILAIDNPRNDLPNSQREIDCAIDTFTDRTVLRHDEATIDAVKVGLAEALIVHFSCHGTANFNDPLNSGLLMSDGLLTLKDLLALNLAKDNGIRLAILSACETGLPGLENIDEVVSLPIGLLQAGVAGVISSLWSVPELSTMVLLSRFYALWRDQKQPPDQALRQAQQWLRDASANEVIAHCQTFIPELASEQGALYRALRQDFSHPYNWAAFSYMGA
jgi:CHAT domain-containing protein/tetratricopeptide (TPR) repeat protein